MKRLRIHLRGVGSLKAEHIAGKFDDHTLHTQADTERGDVVLAEVTDGGKFALHAPLSEARSDDDAVHIGQQFGRIRVVDLLRMDEPQVELAVVIYGSNEQRFVDRFVGVLQFDVLAHEPDTDHVGGALLPVEEVLPRVQLRRGADFKAELLQRDGVHPLALQHEGHLVDGGHVDGLDDGLLRHVAEEGHLTQDLGIELVLRAQDKHIGLHTQLLELLDGVLRGLRLVLLRGGDERHVGQVDAEAVASQLPTQLADALDEGQRLDVAHRATDLGDDEVELVLGAEQLDVALDLVRDVGDHLHRLAQVVSAALLVDDALVDAARGDAVGAGGGEVEEALIVPEVEVCLVPIDGDEALAVFIGVERPRIYVDIRVKLLDRHPVATRLQQLAQRRRDDALTKGRNDTACHKNVLRICHNYSFHFNGGQR